MLQLRAGRTEQGLSLTGGAAVVAGPDLIEFAVRDTARSPELVEHDVADADIPTARPVAQRLVGAVGAVSARSTASTAASTATKLADAGDQPGSMFASGTITSRAVSAAGGTFITTLRC